MTALFAGTIGNIFCGNITIDNYDLEKQTLCNLCDEYQNRIFNPGQDLTADDFIQTIEDIANILPRFREIIMFQDIIQMGTKSTHFFFSHYTFLFIS